MAHYLKNMDFSSDTFYVIHLSYFVFLKDFNCDFLACKQVDALFYFTKSALAKCFGHSIAADDLLTLYLWIFINIMWRKYRQQFWSWLHVVLLIILVLMMVASRR